MLVRENKARKDKFILFIGLWFATLPLSATYSLGVIGGVELTISRLVGILVVIYVSLNLLLARKSKIPTHLWWAVVIFILYMFTHVFFGADWLGDLGVFIRAYGSFALLLYLLCVLNDSKAELIKNVLIFLAVLTAVYTIVQYFIFSISPSLAIEIFGRQAFWGQGSGTVRPGGLLLAAGGSASIMCMGVVLILKRYIERNFNSRLLFYLVVIVLGLGLNFTRTFVFLLVPFILIVLVKYGKWKGVFLYAIVGILSIGFLVNFLGADRFINRFNDIPLISSEKTEKPAFEGRSLLIKIVLDAYKNESFFNQTFGQDYRWASRQIESYYKRAYSMRTGESSTHNDFIWLLSIQGWFGLLLYVIVVTSLILSIKGRQKFFGRLFVLMFFVISGLGGESIPIVGHRYLQVMLIAVLIYEGSKSRIKLRQARKSV